jgi:hypothetical protein
MLSISEVVDTEDGPVGVDCAGPMSSAQARMLTRQIRSSLDETWRLLHLAYERKAWVALAYRSWRQYLEAEFAMSDRNGRYLLTQARVIEALEAASGTTLSSGDVPQRTACALEKVLPEVVERIVDRAATAPGTTRRAIVVEVVGEFVSVATHKRRKPPRALGVTSGTPSADDIALADFIASDLMRWIAVDPALVLASIDEPTRVTLVHRLHLWSNEMCRLVGEM